MIATTLAQWPGMLWLVLGCMLALAAGLANLALLLDRYIVERPLANHGRYICIAAYVFILVGFVAAPFQRAWDRSDVLLFALAGGMGMNAVGALFIVADRLLHRWHAQPWPGPERRSVDRRASDRRRGERRAPFASSRPPQFTDSGRMPFP